MHGDPAEQPLDLVAVDEAGAEVLGRLGPAGDAVGEALLRAAPLVAGGHVAGHEGVAGADRRDRLERLGVDLEQAPLGALADRATQPSGRVIAASLGAQPDDLQQAASARSVAVGELLADQLLGLASRSASPSRRPPRTPASIASPSASSTTGHAAPAQVVDQPRVEVVAGARRQRAGQHADLRAAGQVADPLEEPLRPPRRRPPGRAR